MLPKNFLIVDRQLWRMRSQGGYSIAGGWLVGGQGNGGDDSRRMSQGRSPAWPHFPQIQVSSQFNSPRLGKTTIRLTAI